MTPATSTHITDLTQHALVKWFTRMILSRGAAIALSIAAACSCLMTYFLLVYEGTDTRSIYWILNVDLVLLLLLGAVIGRQVAKLWGDRRRGTAGSQLHVRFVLMFSFLAAVPAILMAVFSAMFLYFGMQTWFNERVSTAVNESLAVAHAYLREHRQVMRADILAMASDLNRESAVLMSNLDVFEQIMRTQSRLRNLSEAVVVTAAGRVIARAPLSLSLEMEGVSQQELERARAGEVVLKTGGTQDRIRALVKLDQFYDSYLHVGRLVDADVLMHMNTAEQAVQEYTTLEGRRSSMQITMTVMFIAVALILLLAAVWFGLRFSEQLVMPIGALILAAERVRMGDLSVRVPAASNDDELGLLGSAFNRMTRQLQAQKEELLTANAMLDERRRFTEAVLAGASSGVIGVGEEGVMTLANARAAELLCGNDNKSLLGQKLADYIPAVQGLPESADASKPIQIEYAVQDGPRRTLLLRATGEQDSSSVVVTIDDITALVSAQRKAAWSDVARRIAHEIKNPLTPIQLSAERLTRKYLPQITEDPETFEKCTQTIIRQVNDIGRMVSEFSDYARMPLPNRKVENIVDVCEDAIVLLTEAHPDIQFMYQASCAHIPLRIDRGQMTQVVTNLLKNAIESVQQRIKEDIENNNIEDPESGRVYTALEDRGDNLMITIADNGIGIPDHIKGDILEPYVTTKKKGSGLGLAIVKKIVEDHDGSVILENNRDEGMQSGAKAVIVLPKGFET